MDAEDFATLLVYSANLAFNEIFSSDAAVNFSTSFFPNWISFSKNKKTIIINVSERKLDLNVYGVFHFQMFVFLNRHLAF